VLEVEGVELEVKRGGARGWSLREEGVGLEVKWGGARGGGVELEVKKGGTNLSNKFAGYIP